MALAGTTVKAPAHLAPGPPPASTSVIKKWLSTTPGMLRALSLLIVFGALLSVVAGLGAGTQRRHGLSTAASGAEPLLVSAQKIHTSLAKANAAAATAFLAGGVEPTFARDAYTESIATASKELATATEQAGSSGKGAEAIQVITTKLPVYTGLVESARANNRQGFPIGAAYLRQASALMNGSDGILAAVDRLSSDAEQRFEHAKDEAASPVGITLAVLATLFLLGAIGVTGLFLFRRTNRMLNVGLVVGAVATVAWLVWALAAASGQAGKLRDAQTAGADSVQVLSRARTAAFQAKGDESLSLITHGNGAALDADFDAATTLLIRSTTQDGDTSRGDGLLGLAAQLADSPEETQAVQAARTAFANYLDVHQTILGHVGAGEGDEAVRLATQQGEGTSNAAFDPFDVATAKALDLNQEQFEKGASDARGELLGLNPFATVLLVIAAGAALWGIQQRLNEYR